MNFLESWTIFKYIAHPQVEVKDSLPYNKNKQINSKFETGTHYLAQSKENQNKMIEKWMSKTIPTKAPSANVNSDSKTFQKQQMEFSNRNNYITSQEEELYKTMESNVAPSTSSSLPDDLCESTSQLFSLSCS